MQVHNTVSQAELLKVFADFTDKNRMDRTFTPQTSKTPIKTEKEIKKDKFERKYGAIYTGAAVLVGGGILLALRRGGKLFDLNKFIKKHAIEKFRKIANSDNLTHARVKTSLYANTFWGKLQNACNIMGNLNPLKDIYTAKVLDFFKIKKPFDKITNLYVSYGKKLAKSKYNLPQKHLNEFRNHLSNAIKEIAKMGEKQMPITRKKEILEQLQKLSSLSNDEMLSIIRNFDTRYDTTVKTLNRLAEKRFLKTVTNTDGKRTFEFLKQKANEFGDFIPEKIMQTDKSKIFQELLAGKTKLSNNILDLGKTISQKTDDIFFNNLLDKPEVRKSYTNIKDLIEKFTNPKKFNLKRDDVRNLLLKELDNAKGLNVLDDAKKADISSLINLIKNDKKGAIEEAVSLCKDLQKTNPELYNTLKASRDKFQKSLGKAIEFETEKSYGRLLDFSLEAVPSDVISQVATIGAIGAVMADRKKSKEEKISTNLKMGIPLLGGLAVSALCNLRQVASGVNAILLGIITTAILNRIGNIADKKYQFHLLAKKNDAYLKSQASS